MRPHPARARALAAVRAGGLAGIALTAAAVAWHLRPNTPGATPAPEAEIVLGCAWLAWALAAYLCLAVAATALAHLAGMTARSGGPLAAIAPAGLRRLVETTITLGIAAAICGAGTAAPALATGSGHATAASAGRPSTGGDALDWPGLGMPAATTTHHAESAPDRARAGDSIVVRPGDSLWVIAARQLGPHATSQAIAAAWPRLYTANRHVIGADPGLIYPGQRLRLPSAASTTGRSTGNAR
jgi:hypothetical protein